MANLSSTPTSISTPTPTPTPILTPTPLPSQLSTRISRRSPRVDERRIRGVVWRLIGHQSQYRNTVGSPVWNHGDIYIKSGRPRDGGYFICDYYRTVIKTQKNGSTNNFRRHLVDKHRIALNEREIEEVEVEEDVQSSIERPEVEQRRLTALVTTIDANRFRACIVRLFTYCQLSYNLIERPEFRELLLYIQPSIERFIVGRKIMGN